MPRPDPEAVEKLLSRRRTLLERVQHGPVPKPVLVEEVAISRSTVDRAVRELETARLVRRIPEGVVLTLAGRVALQRYRRYQSSLGDLARATDVLAPLPTDVVFDPSLIDDATVVTPEQHEPRRPVERLLRTVRAVHRIRAVVVAYVPEVVTAVLERVTDGDLQANVVATPAVLDLLVRHHADELDAAIRAGLRLSQVEVTDAPYTLLLVDRTDETAVCISVSRDGAVTGLLRNEGDAAVTWATRRFEAVQQSANSIRDQ